MKGLGGLGDMSRIVKQAQSQMKDLQKQLSDLNETLKDQAVEGSAGGGMVRAVFNGLQEPLDVKIDPAVLKEDLEFVQEMILAAVRQGLKKSREMSEEQRKRITGGLSFPGLESLL